jgi:hypothetical protein
MSLSAIYAYGFLSHALDAYVHEVRACPYAHDCEHRVSLCVRVHGYVCAGVHGRARGNVHGYVLYPREDVCGREYANAYAHAHVCVHVCLS